MLITIVGDVTLDLTVRQAGVRVAAGDVPATIASGAGGQAANVAVRLARRGANVRLVGAIGDDAAGRTLRSLLAAESVDLRPLASDRTSVVVALIAADGERSMLSDRRPLQGDVGGALAGSDWVHVSGYALRDPAEARRLIAGLARAGRAGVSVAGGSFGPAESGNARDAIASLDPRLLVLGRPEAAALLGITDERCELEALASGLANASRLVVVTAGQGGSAAAGGVLTEPLRVPAAAPRGQLVDATGAGDAYTAVLLMRLAPVWPPTPGAVRTAMEEASAVGGRVSRVVGAQGHVAGERQPRASGAATVGQ